MTKTLLTFAWLISMAMQLNAQAPCGTMEYQQQKIKADSGLMKQIAAYNAALDAAVIAAHSNTKRAIYTIPVVVHVLYKKDTQNIPDKRIFDQIDIINRDFAGRNPHSMGAFPASLKADVGVQFCLAKFKPDGSAFNGINRVYTTADSFIQDDKMKFTASGGVDAWDPSRYLNIWVCNYVVKDQLGYVFSAYAQFPSQGINSTYGVAIRYGAFGPTDSSYYRGNGGILTHELGHCLNVFHIWGDDNTSCSGSDLCFDTPNQAGRSTGLHTGALTDVCSPDTPGVMYMNFMDYCDDIIYANFSPDQAARMQANFTMANSPLLKLSQSSACRYSTGISPASHSNLPPFQLFPNPAGNQITLTYSSPFGNAPALRIYDLYGRLLLSTVCLSPHSHTVDISQFSKGVYMLVMVVEGKVWVERLVVE